MQHSFAHPRLILAAVVFGAAAFLGARDGWTQPAKAGYANPTPLSDANGNLLGNVKRSESPYIPLNVSGTRNLQFDDLINGQGTTYNVYLWLDAPGATEPANPLPNPTTGSFPTFTKGVDPEPFTLPVTLTVNDNPNTAQYAAAGNRFWNWEVDVTSADGTMQTSGDVWQFRVPLEVPTNNSTDVSVYCKFEWEASSDYTSGVKQESCYILDPNDPKDILGFYDAAGTGPNTALTHKDVNLAPKAPLYYGLWPYYRQFWIHDASYLFQGYSRLQPSTTYQWRIWYTTTGSVGTVAATATLELLQAPPVGMALQFSITDPTVTPSITETFALPSDGSLTLDQGVFAADVLSALSSAGDSNIAGITVTDNTNASGVLQNLTLTWPVLGTGGNKVTITAAAGDAGYMETLTTATPPVAAGAGTATSFSGGLNSTGLYGPTYTFTTVSEADVDAVDGDAGANYDPGVQALIVYWQHPEGSLARDPQENVATFYSLARQLQAIHSNDLQPSVKTLIFGTEQMAASYGGLDTYFQGSAQNNIQQVYVPDITQFTGWYTLGGTGAEDAKGAYDVAPYNTRVSPKYDPTSPSNVVGISPRFFSSADTPTGPHPYATQDRYHEWVAKGIRTWLQDAANLQAFGLYNDHAWLPALQYITLLGDAERVAPSFYYYYIANGTASNRWLPAENVYFSNLSNRWLPTDFFYTTQNGQTPAVVSTTVGTIPAGGRNNAGGYEVSRIPIRGLPMIYTIDQNVPPQQFPPAPSSVSENPSTLQFPPEQPISFPYSYASGAGDSFYGYFDPLPFLSKIRDYCDLLNSSPTDSAKQTAFSTWFSQVVMVDGATEYYKWFQFFPAFAQYLLGLQVQPVVNGPLHDAFSGMFVRKYDLNGTSADDGGVADYDESLTLSNILGRMSIDNGYDSNGWNTATADSDVPGFLYLLARGGTNYGGEDSDLFTGTAGETLAGGVVDLTPADSVTGPATYLSTFDPTQMGAYPAELTLTTQWFPTYIPSVNYTPLTSIPYPSPANFTEPPTTLARPILVSPANVITRFDSAIWGINPFTGSGSNQNTSLGESAILAQGGPIAVAGFTSGRYLTSVEYGAGDTDAVSDITYGGPTDENEGYEYPTIGPSTYSPTNTYGTADLTQFSADTDAVLGKVELTSYIAKWYALSTSPVAGYLFNQALAEYVNLHHDDFTLDDQREATTIFGATLLGDSAVSMPGPEPLGAGGDYSRPIVTDTNPRAATPVTGYSPVSAYNSQNIPVHVIAQYVSPPYVTLATNPKATANNEGATVALQIQTAAPHVRVRVFTPFEQNTSYSSGGWVAQAGASPPVIGVDLLQNASGNSLTASDGSTSTTNELICSVPAGKVTVTFNPVTPSIYFVVIQAEGPAWTASQSSANPSTPPYQWLQERWFYIQVVNEWFRLDPTGKTNNLLLVDMDQHDRYYLNGDIFTQHQLNMLAPPFGNGTHVLPTVPPNINPVPWDTMADTFYVDPTQPDGTGIGPTPPEDESDSPALPYLNNQPSILNKYQYQFWCGNVYHTLATYGSDILSSQRYYGEITPDALQSFQSTDGVVLWYTGDFNLDYPAEGYLFQYEALMPPETGYLTSYLSNAGHLWMDSQDLTTESANSVLTNGSFGAEPETRTATREPWAETFLSKYLGATPMTLYTEGSILDGNFLGTMSGGFTPDTDVINGVDDAGGDGRNSLDFASEVDPLSLTQLAATVFKWDSPSGVIITTGTKSAATQNIVSSGGKGALALGGQAIFFTWPLESVNHLGDITDDATGRAYILKAAIDWLSSATKPVLPGPVSNMLPADGSTTTTLLVVFSWTAGLDATSYILEYGPGTTLPLSPTIVDLATTTYTPKTALVSGKTYTWTVFSVNADGETAGPTQTFIAHAAAIPPGGSTSTTTGTTGAGGGGGGGGGCFIATAGYESSSRRPGGVVETNCTGSYVIAPERLRQLNNIRSLRDDLLAQFPAGRVFSAWYYAIGPYGADAIRGNEPAKAAVRVMLLNPLAELSRECAQAEKK